MKILCTPPRAGKTTAAIQLAAKEDAYIVCIDHPSAWATKKQADEMGLTIRFPLTLSELLNKSVYKFQDQKYVIDNADLILQHLCGGRAIFASITALPKIPPWMKELMK